MLILSAYWQLFHKETFIILLCNTMALSFLRYYYSKYGNSIKICENTNKFFFLTKQVEWTTETIQVWQRGTYLAPEKNINSPTKFIEYLLNFRYSTNTHGEYKEGWDADSAPEGFISIRYKQMTPRLTNVIVIEWKVESALISYWLVTVGKLIFLTVLQFPID